MIDWAAILPPGSSVNKAALTAGLEALEAEAEAALPNATQAEAEAATSNATGMSPLRTKQQLDYRGRPLNLKDFGGKCDVKIVTLTLSITSGQISLLATGGTFAAADVGKRIAVPGAGAAGAVLTTTIAAVTDATHISLGATASTTLTTSAQNVAYGTDDTAAWNAMLAAATSALLVSPLPCEFLGHSAISSTITIPPTSNLVIRGFGGGSEGLIARKPASKLVWLGGSANTYMLKAGDGGSTAVKGLKLADFAIDAVYSSLAKSALQLNDTVQNSVFEGLLLENVSFGLAVGASCFSNTYRECEFYINTTVSIDLTELDHSTLIVGCTFRNASGGVDTPDSCIRIGSGGSGAFHSSNVTILGCNLNNYRVTRFIDAQDAWALSVLGNYMEGQDNSMVSALRLGVTADANKKVDGAIVSGNRITTASGSPAANAIDCQRVSGLTVEGNYFASWSSSCLKVDHTNSDRLVWLGNDPGGVAVADGNGVALALVVTDIGAFTGKFGSNVGATGSELLRSGVIRASASSAVAMEINRRTSDGNIVSLYLQDVSQGIISGSGSTITYGTFCGSHWSQLADNAKPEILRGTVLESIDAMAAWEGEANDTLARIKVSDVAGSRRVYGVFFDWSPTEADDGAITPGTEGDMLVASLGAFVVRIHADATVTGGDLLESAGDGTARVQIDNVIRSSTIAKVTSSHVVETYPDGSFLVPATLHCG